MVVKMATCKGETEEMEGGMGKERSLAKVDHIQRGFISHGSGTSFIELQKVGEGLSCLFKTSQTSQESTSKALEPLL